MNNVGRGLTKTLQHLGEKKHSSAKSPLPNKDRGSGLLIPLGLEIEKLLKEVNEEQRIVLETYLEHNVLVAETDVIYIKQHDKLEMLMDKTIQKYMFNLKMDWEEFGKLSKEDIPRLEEEVIEACVWQGVMTIGQATKLSNKELNHLTDPKILRLIHKKKLTVDELRELPDSAIDKLKGDANKTSEQGLSSNPINDRDEVSGCLSKRTQETAPFIRERQLEEVDCDICTII